MRIRHILVGLLVSLQVLVCGSGVTAEITFTDDFEDGNLQDGVPVTWLGTDIDNGAISADDGAMLFDPQFGATDGYVDAYLSLPSFTNNVIELTVEFLSDANIFFGVDPREPLDDEQNGYWAGITGEGELGIGYSTRGDNTIARRGAFLPDGPVTEGTVLDMRIEAIENIISIAAWPSGGNPVDGAILSWTDRNDLYPTGDLFAPFLNPNGTLGAVAVRQIRATYTPVGHSAVEGDFNGNGSLDVEDINRLTEVSASPSPDVVFDLNEDGMVDSIDVTTWIKDLGNSWVGDSNFDGEFNSADFVGVFQAGTYEQGVNANWSQGDWTGDGRFNSADFVAAFQDGGFEQGPRNAIVTVPEPNSIPIVVVVIGLSIVNRARRRLVQ